MKYKTASIPDLHTGCYRKMIRWVSPFIRGTDYLGRSYLCDCIGKNEINFGTILISQKKVKCATEAFGKDVGKCLSLEKDTPDPHHRI